MPNEVDPIFLIIANSMMKNSSLPHVLANCEKTVRKYFAECLAGSTERVNLDASPNEIVRATLDLVLLHYSTGDDISSEVESSLEIAGVEVELTPGSIAAETQLNRFSGIDLNES